MKELNTSLERQVSERTAVAEERAREAAAVAEVLHEQTRTLQAILRNMAEGVVVADAAGNPSGTRVSAVTDSAPAATVNCHVTACVVQAPSTLHTPGASRARYVPPAWRNT